MTVAALIVGAGRGERYRASLTGAAEREPAKAFVLLAGRTLLEHAARALCAVPEISLVVPVLSSEAIGEMAQRAPGLVGLAKLGAPVAGGAERQDSVRAGLAALPASVRLVAVHDAARPLVRPEDVTRVIRAAEASGAAILAAPVADTVKRVREGRVVETPPRSECFAAQTPQVFRVDWLREALAKAEAEGVRGTDDAALVERLGIVVHVVTGPATNLKITTAADLRLAETLLAGTEGSGRESGGGAGVRIGHGFDAHRLVSGRPLWLGGVRIPSERGLLGHSDGDALLHAVADAILGVLGQGDLGRHFGSDDPARKDAASGDLREVVVRMRDAGFRVGNLDATVIAEAPRLAPHQEEMRKSVAELVGAALADVNVKLKSTDGLGALGREEGIAAQAVVLLVAEESRR